MRRWKQKNSQQLLYFSLSLSHAVRHIIAGTRRCLMSYQYADYRDRERWINRSRWPRTKCVFNAFGSLSDSSQTPRLSNDLIEHVYSSDRSKCDDGTRKLSMLGVSFLVRLYSSGNSSWPESVSRISKWLFACSAIEPHNMETIGPPISTPL